jgi:hypothetical protein
MASSHVVLMTMMGGGVRRLASGARIEEADLMTLRGGAVARPMTPAAMTMTRAIESSSPLDFCQVRVDLASDTLLFFSGAFSVRLRCD